jgi:superfamily I DNA and/or RNA helicase
MVWGCRDRAEEAQVDPAPSSYVLDETKAAGIPVRDLKWHYHSRSESLIAFSNHHYYQNRLVTFPSPALEDRAVRLRKVPNGVYDRGESRTNRIEAQAVADEESEVDGPIPTFELFDSKLLSNEEIHVYRNRELTLFLPIDT